jgi:cyclic di-GMP phosphodiesterase
MRSLMARWATSLGLEPTIAANADEAIAAVRAQPCDLAVIDVLMPGRTGLWLADQLRRHHPDIAVVFATGHTELLDADTGPRVVADLLVKPFEKNRFALAVDRARSWSRDAMTERSWHGRLSAELRDRTEQICAEIDRRQPDGASDADRLASIARERTPETAAHGERVARYAQAVARELGQARELAAVLEPAARFHDIGKIAMPEALLTKPSPLTADEIAIMRTHVTVGAEILASTRTLWQAAPVVGASHEWFGGGGYPSASAGEAIPLASRIIAVADAYDAMTQNRPYRPRRYSTEAIEELLRCRGVQFDPDVLTAFLAVLGRH